MGHILDILKSGQSTNANIISVDKKLKSLHKQATDKPKDKDACLIQAFLLARDNNKEIPEWVLSRLNEIFYQYYQTKIHPLYDSHPQKKNMQKLTISDCFDINNRVFQTIRKKREKVVRIDKVCHYKWLFGLGNKETVQLLQISGFNYSTKEAEIERAFERYVTAGYYKTFLDVVENHEWRDVIIQTEKSLLTEKMKKHIRIHQRTQGVKSAPIQLFQQ